MSIQNKPVPYKLLRAIFEGICTECELPFEPVGGCYCTLTPEQRDQLLPDPEGVTGDALTLHRLYAVGWALGEHDLASKCRAAYGMARGAGMDYHSALEAVSSYRRPAPFRY
jgi:hypothetical protein